MTERLKVTVNDGKYTVIQTDTGLRALRYDEEWRDLTGDGLVLALAQEIEELREFLRETVRICEAVRYTAGLGKNQMDRLEKARAILARAKGKQAA